MLKLASDGIIAINAQQPPSGGCVLKQLLPYGEFRAVDSRLQAAVC